MDSNDDRVLDLSGHGIKKIPRNLVSEKSAHCIEVYLNNNEIQKLEFLSGLQNVEKFCASHNQLLRMYGVQSFRHLVHLDLSYNKIICIEGLREITHLLYLNLAHNKIKELDHTLQKNVRLEYLDVSENIIASIPNMSHLIKLKTFMIHGNQISNLRHCELYLPKSLEKLTLANNKITDLNEVCHLVELINLKEISLSDNPCVENTGQAIGVEYRPFLVNWCLALKVIDGFAVNDMECLKGEWLYSQGKGRKFRPGEHKELIQYLSENIPFTGDHLDSEQDRKLRLILSKAREHKSPLNPQLGPGKVISRVTPQIMSRSLDPSLLGKSCEQQNVGANLLSRSLHCTSLGSEKEPVKEDDTAPLPAASKLVPVPESLVSPMVTNIPDITSVNSPQKDSPLDYPSNEMQSTSKLVNQNEDSFPPALDKIKLQAIKSIAEEMKVKKSSCMERGPLIDQFKFISEQVLPESISSNSTSSQELESEICISDSLNDNSSICGFEYLVDNNAQDIPSEDERELGRLIGAIETIYFGDTELEVRSSSSSGSSIKTKKSNEPLFPTPCSSSSSLNLQRTASATFIPKSDEAVGDGNNQCLADDAREQLKREEAVRTVVTQLIEQIEKRYTKPDLNKQDDAAARIQKVWRGYRARNQQNNVHSLVNSMELRRVHEHVVKLNSDVEAVKIALENEHKLHVLQIQAINGLWRKLNAMQIISNDDQPEIRDLSDTCEKLNNQVQQLQLCMEEVMRCVGRCSSPAGSCVSTQTEITAVHTPSEECSFPYSRPCSLPLSTHHVSHFTDNFPDTVKDIAPPTVEEFIE